MVYSHPVFSIPGVIIRLARPQRWFGTLRSTEPLRPSASLLSPMRRMCESGTKLQVGYSLWLKQGFSVRVLRRKVVAMYVAGLTLIPIIEESEI